MMDDLSSIKIIVSKVKATKEISINKVLVAKIKKLGPDNR
jgi:hypothetical protein